MSGHRSSAPLPWKWFALWAGGFALLTAPLLWSTRTTNFTWDEANYYLPSILQIRAHWPKVELINDSLSATSPAYAYFLATCSFLVGPSTIAMRLVNWLVSLGVLAVLWALLQRRGGWPLTLALLPLALSNFFLKSSSYLVTDNAALLGMTGSLCVLIFTPTPNAAGPVAGLATATVALRQMNIWLLAPLAWRVWQDWRTRRRWHVVLWLFLPVVPLAILWHAWGGLVPPIWQARLFEQTPLTGAPLVYALSVLLTLGLGFYLAVTNSAHWKQDFQQPWVWGLGLLGLGLALATPSNPSHDAGRWGGYWWNLAGHLPLFGQVSTLFLVLAPLGAIFGGALIHRLWCETDRDVTLVCVLIAGAWSAAMVASRLVFHRYYEPPVLLFLIFWIALIAFHRPRFRLLRRWPLLLLALGQLGVTLGTAYARVFGLL